MSSEQFSLDGHPFVELNNLMKILGWCGSGGVAKQLIADGLVKVDGEVELRKRCKIRQGQSVEFDGNTAVVAA